MSGRVTNMSRPARDCSICVVEVAMRLVRDFVANDRNFGGFFATFWRNFSTIM